MGPRPCSRRCRPWPPGGGDPRSSTTSSPPRCAASRGHNQSAGAAGLTEQELRILEKIAAGLPNKQIGRELDIAEGTVKVHVKHILRKLELRSRVEAAVWAVEHLRA